MDYAEIKKKKTEVFQANDRNSFELAVKELADLIKGDKNPDEKYIQECREWLKKVKAKKEEWWRQAEERKNNKLVRYNYILRENEGIAFANLCNALSKWLLSKT